MVGEMPSADTNDPVRLTRFGRDASLSAPRAVRVLQRGAATKPTRTARGSESLQTSERGHDDVSTDATANRRDGAAREHCGRRVLSLSDHREADERSGDNMQPRASPKQLGPWTPSQDERISS